MRFLLALVAATAFPAGAQPSVSPLPALPTLAHLSGPADGARALLTPAEAAPPAQLRLPRLVLTPAPGAPSLGHQPPQVHEVVRGDTLNGIFRRLRLEPAALDAVLAADEELVALDVLRPGQRLLIETQPGSRRLLALSLVDHPGRTIRYQRATDGTFTFEEILAASHWHEEILAAPVRGSFALSAARMGLSEADVERIAHIFEGRVDFEKDLQANDSFEIALSRESADFSLTGRTRIEAIRLHLAGSGTHDAFLHTDGHYYDERGESLQRAFLRLPTEDAHRVSSPFDLRRVHPVTRRVAPHHGVDFAMPIGTPVMTTADGVVTRVGRHRYAGRYVEIEHPGSYKTRYLHLSRAVVKTGQRVKRGQRIALSGNTGRSTGPHLHFELHVDGRPVDPVTANIPSATQIAKADLPLFMARVQGLRVAMSQAAVNLAAASRTAPVRMAPAGPGVS